MASALQPTRVRLAPPPVGVVTNAGRWRVRGNSLRPRAVPTRASSADSTTEIDVSSRNLAVLLGTSLGVSTRASESTRLKIDAEVAHLERHPGPEAPIASDLLDGTWVLRYTTSPGTVSAISGWTTIAGAMTDVRQRCERNTKSTDVTVTNIVTVDVPPFASSVQITQVFVAVLLSKRRWRIELRRSDVDLRRSRGKNKTESESSPSVAGVLVNFFDPLGVIKSLAKNFVTEESPGESLFKLTQPLEGASRPPPKQQITTHVSKTWRVVREMSAADAVSVYSRLGKQSGSDKEPCDEMDSRSTR
mmetsp:Transcript_4269/g.15777  ORF Transcript_4269/g.15777 Transcript_4269/m.15777 type:complete len:304 (-) Transcript_4269:1857-2768(-)